MSNEITVLAITAASLGFFHTLFGPDHYLPFIMMARAGKWPLPKTAAVTVLCGIGHVLGSVILGLIGVAVGISVTKLESVESARGDIAAWLLIGFGFAYFIWGLRNAWLNRPHRHSHLHPDGSEHEHEHTHKMDHAHLHKKAGKKGYTPWILFVIFVLGPCEPLIPLLMYPAAQQSLSGLIMVTAVFGAATIVTMTAIVIITSLGFKQLRFGRLERYSHALAGAMISVSGLAIIFLGL